MNEKFLGMLGMAKRAGKVISGEAVCSKAIKNGEAELVIIASDASENTKKSVVNSCRYYGVDYIEAASMSDIGKYTGSASERAVAVVKDNNFAKAILDKYQ